MKYWHRKIHLIIWVILLLFMAPVFFLGINFVQYKNPWSDPGKQIELFEQWEKEFNSEEKNKPKVTK